MQLKSVDVIEFPIDSVFKTFRDKLKELVPYLPNIKDIDVISREEIPPSHVKILNHWHGEVPIPKMIQSYFNPEMFSWKDNADWFEDKYECFWALETFYGKKLFQCKGKTVYTALNANRTEVSLKGELDINADVIPVPGLLKRTLKPQIENLVITLLTPNFSSVNKGIISYLKSHK